MAEKETENKEQQDLQHAMNALSRRLLSIESNIGCLRQDFEQLGIGLRRQEQQSARYDESLEYHLREHNENNALINYLKSASDNTINTPEEIKLRFDDLGKRIEELEKTTATLDKSMSYHIAHPGNYEPVLIEKLDARVAELEEGLQINDMITKRTDAYLRHHLEHTHVDDNKDNEDEAIVMGMCCGNCLNWVEVGPMKSGYCSARSNTFTGITSYCKSMFRRRDW